MAVAASLAPSPVLGTLLAAGILRLGGRRRAGTLTGDLHALVPRLAVVLLAVATVDPTPRDWVVGLAAGVAVAVPGRFLQVRLNNRRDHGLGTGEATVIVGETLDLQLHVRQFAARPELGVRPVATVGPATDAPTMLPHLDPTALSEVLAAHQASHVMVVSPCTAMLSRQVDHARDAGCRVTVVPPLGDQLTAGAEIVDVRGIPMLTLAPRRAQSGPDWWVKRTVDLVGATIALVAGAPIFVLAAAAVKLEDGGPVLFRQQRIGRNGRLFTMWKFRSMVVDADARKAGLVADNQAAGPFFKIEDDPRITRVGRVLRRLSIDELPQLANVLRGEMSLVGPRPCLPDEALAAPEVFDRRQAFVPGITGLWQVAGQSWIPIEEGIRMDRAYIEHWSPWLDLRILARTALVALRNDRRPPVTALSDLVELDRRRYASMVDADDLGRGDHVDVSIVVVTHQSADQIESCLASVMAMPDRASREVIVVDNASTDTTASVVRQRFPAVRLIRKRRRDGFATNSNIGVVASSGRHVMMLNPDARLRAGALDLLVEHLDDNPAVGAVGPVLVYPDGRPQPSARAFPAPLNAFVRRTPLRRVFPSVADGHLLDPKPATPVRDVDWLLGGAIAIRRSALEQVGGFDDGYRLYCEDIDLCWRLHENAWRVQQLAEAVIEHDLDELTTRKFMTWRTVWHLRSVVRFLRLRGLGRPTTVIDLREKPVSGPVRTGFAGSVGSP